VGVNVSSTTWLVRALWLSLPISVGDLLAGSIDGRSRAVGITAVAIAWLVWAGGLFASLVTLPPGLTALRILVPLPLAGSVVAAIDTDPSAIGWFGLATSAAVVVAALSGQAGDDFVNGASYGDERRFALRPPGALLLGPVPLLWVVTTLPLVAGALLLAARQWLPGALLVAAGAAAAWWGTRVLHRLAQRFVVFVPAGLTLVDPLVIAQPVLFQRRHVTRIGPAPVDTDALDLTAAAPGLILEVALDAPVEVVPEVRRGQQTAPVEARSALIAPSRPGALLAQADARDLSVQRG
jgi:hypothetical protein